MNPGSKPDPLEKCQRQYFSLIGLGCILVRHEHYLNIKNEHFSNISNFQIWYSHSVKCWSWYSFERTYVCSRRNRFRYNMSKRIEKKVIIEIINRFPTGQHSAHHPHPTVNRKIGCHFSDAWFVHEQTKKKKNASDKDGIHRLVCSLRCPTLLKEAGISLLLSFTRRFLFIFGFPREFKWRQNEHSC